MKSTSSITYRIPKTFLEKPYKQSFRNCSKIYPIFFPEFFKHSSKNSFRNSSGISPCLIPSGIPPRIHSFMNSPQDSFKDSNLTEASHKIPSKLFYSFFRRFHQGFHQGILKTFVHGIHQERSSLHSLKDFSKSSSNDTVVNLGSLGIFSQSFSRNSSKDSFNSYIKDTISSFPEKAESPPKIYSEIPLWIITGIHA